MRNLLVNAFAMRTIFTNAGVPLIMPVTLVRKFDRLRTIIGVKIILVPLINALRIILHDGQIRARYRPDQVLLKDSMFRERVRCLPNAFLVERTYVMFGVLVNYVRD